MPSLVPHPVTGLPVWDYDLPPVEDKPAKKAAKKTVSTNEDEES